MNASNIIPIRANIGTPFRNITQYPTWLETLKSNPPLRVDGRWRNGTFIRYVSEEERVPEEAAATIVFELYSKLAK